MSSKEWKGFTNIIKDTILDRTTIEDYLHVEISYDEFDEYTEQSLLSFAVDELEGDTYDGINDLKFIKKNHELIIQATSDISYVKIRTYVALTDDSDTTYTLQQDTEIPKKRNLFMDHEKPNLMTIKGFYEDGTYYVNSEYQRSYIWDITKASRLIESLLLKIPIPTVYCSEVEEGNKYEIIDGQQRVYTIYNFLTNKFRLKNLESLPMLNGLNISHLEEKHENAYKLLINSSIPFIMITKESDPDIKFDVFMRINQGATDLNAQELRNSMYRGELTNALKHLRTTDTIRKIMNSQEGGHLRYQDMELLVRILAIYDTIDFTTYQLKKEGGNNEFIYRGNMKHFLNAYMRNNQHMLSPDVSNTIKNLTSMFEIIYTIFANKTFRRPDKTSRTINSALVDIISTSFLYYVSQHKEKQLVEYKEKIVELLEKLCTHSDFISSISSGTSGIKNINTRLYIWFTELDKLIKG